MHSEVGKVSAFETRSVLLLPKLPRWRHELASRGLNEDAARELVARGEAWPRAAHMCKANDAHNAAVSHLERCFGEAGIAVRTLAAAEATAADVAAHAPELVCTAGGDGTLLRTATLLPPSTPLLAINTDPERSTGALCSAHLSPHAAAASAAHVAASLRGGDFSVRPLPRLRATIEDAAGARTLLAINEVFVGEVDPVRPCALEVRVSLTLNPTLTLTLTLTLTRCDRAPSRWRSTAGPCRSAAPRVCSSAPRRAPRRGLLTY